MTRKRSSRFTDRVLRGRAGRPVATPSADRANHEDLRVDAQRARHARESVQRHVLAGFESLKIACRCSERFGELVLRDAALTPDFGDALRDAADKVLRKLGRHPTTVAVRSGRLKRSCRIVV
jgi:hypothetical protein